MCTGAVISHNKTANRTEPTLICSIIRRMCVDYDSTGYLKCTVVVMTQTHKPRVH